MQVVVAIVEVLNFVLGTYSTQASKPTQVYVEGNSTRKTVSSILRMLDTVSLFKPVDEQSH
ncbi:hypothetical protein SB89_14905 (plasmid) [Corynebacterium glutamicum]|nr:hypothetical protein SB89_14905 [Corynebacterium glutamicum]OKX90472.1 hypothetical protein AUP72_09465 [Corynebacterium glutamicum]